jgi:lycopene beta-cyclase
VTDVLLVGGGLANALIAWRLHERRPELRVRLIEAGDRTGGVHTWSFHASDLSDAERAWVLPLVERSWSGYEVRFPSRRRVLEAPYHAITSSGLDRRLRERLGDRILLRARAEEVTPSGVRLRDGSRIEARLVVDGRGFERIPPGLHVGYQKFLGRRVRLNKPHGIARPILMDATVPQEDGFRFVYVLPWDEASLLVEDTRYSDGPALAMATLQARIVEYLAALGLAVEHVEHEEAGALPLPLRGDLDELWSGLPPGVPPAGVRAGLFHPTTGYSLPQAVRLAHLLAEMPRLDSARVRAQVRLVAERLWREGAFFRLLNRMLFEAPGPGERYRVLERFYGLPEELIRRFYAGRLRGRDKLRLLAGRPPVPLLRAARAALS